MPRKKRIKTKTIITIFLILFIIFVVGIVYYSINNNNKAEELATDLLGEKNKVETKKEEDNINSKEEIIKEKNEDKNKEEENENKKEDKEEINKNIYQTSFTGQSLSFEYPDNWQANQLEEKNKFSFGPKGKAIAEEYQGDIIIAYKENKQKLPIERYYDGLNDINLFEDASGGFKKEKSGKYDFYRFKDVIGYTSSTIGIFVLSDFFVEMTDVYNKHQEDEVFDQLVQSFKAE